MNTEHDRMDASHSNARLYFSALGVYSLFISVGAYVAWSAPAIPKLNEMGIPAEKVTLMASIPGLAPGSLITMFGIDTIGRKGTLLVAWLALMLCWVLSCITQQIDVLLIARFIGGWGMSCAFSASGIYISEISDLDSRAFLNSINTIFGGVGCIVAVSTGPFLSFSNFIIEITCLTIIFGLIYLFLPESPYFFVSKGNMHKARSVVVWLRKGSPDKYIDREMSEIKKIIEEEKKNKTGVRKLFSSKVVFKQLSFALFMLYFQQATAYNAVSNYSMAIFQKADINFDAAYMMIALSVSMMIFALPTPFLMKYIGNKKISIVTGIGCAISNDNLDLSGEW